MSSKSVLNISSCGAGGGATNQPFARLNADPAVMEHFPGVLSQPESYAGVDRIEAQFAELGYGLWAVEALDQASAIGFVRLSVPNFKARFMPAVEIGWRLDRA